MEKVRLPRSRGSKTGFLLLEVGGPESGECSGIDCNRNVGKNSHGKLRRIGTGVDGHISCEKDRICTFPTSAKLWSMHICLSSF